ncbi:hypothetical protein ABNE29_20320 [Paenibacillus larvae]
MNVKEITERLEMIADVESLKTINSIYSDRSDSFVSVNNVEALRQASALLNPKPIPKSEWHEDHGAVLWWKFPIVEPHIPDPHLMKIGRDIILTGLHL